MSKLTTLPNVFIFLAAAGTPYRMTKLSNGDYACTEQNEEFKDDGGRLARHTVRDTLRRINDGTWTFVKDITEPPLPRKFTILTILAVEYDVDLDAEVVVSVESGVTYKGYNEARVVDYINSGSWTITKSKTEREAEAKAAIEAEVNASFEAFETAQQAFVEATNRLAAAITKAKLA